MNSRETPLYLFLHASDPHFGMQTDKNFAGADVRAASFIKDAAAMRPVPRFCLITGDISSRGNHHPEELAEADNTFAQLPMPTFFVPGNHDLRTGTGEKQADGLQAIHETNWYKHFGEEGLFWAERFEPLEFVGFALRNGDPDGILAKVADHLQKPFDGWRVLVNHYPVYPVRAGGTLDHWGSQHIVDSVAPLQQLMQQHADKVVAYLFGHVHALTTQVHDGILHASGGALAVGAPGYRVFSVFADRLESRFYPISNAEYANFAFWGHSTDDTHPTVDAYHRGTDLEQNFAFNFRTRVWSPLETQD